MNRVPAYAPASIFRTDDWNDVEVKITAPAVNSDQEVRRVIATQVKAINEKRKELDPGSKESEALTKQLLKWRKRLRAD